METNKTQEQKIINDIIAVNLDACSFYRDVAEKMTLPVAESVFHNLERIHTGIVEGLGLAAYRDGHPASIDLDMDRGHSAFPRDEHGFSLVDVDCHLVDAVENAENRCIDILTEAIHSDDVSSDIKMHMLEAATMLNDRHEHIHRLKSLAFVQGQEH